MRAIVAPQDVTAVAIAMQTDLPIAVRIRAPGIYGIHDFSADSKVSGFQIMRDKPGLEQVIDIPA